MISLTLVGTRQGKPAIHWPHTIIAFFLMGGAMGAGSALGCYFFGWPYSASSRNFWVLLPIFIIGRNIFKALRLPPEQLTRLD